MNLLEFQPAIDSRLRQIERDGLEGHPWVTVAVPTPVALTLGEILVEDLEEHGGSFGVRDDWAQHGNRLRVVDRFMRQVHFAQAEGARAVQVEGRAQYVRIVICWIAEAGVWDLIHDTGRTRPALGHGGVMLEAAGSAIREYEAVMGPEPENL